MKAFLARFIKFGLVGIVGFAVDAGVLLLVKPWLGPFVGRGASFLVAVTITFILNRTFVFQTAPREGLLRQWRRFLAANLFGAALNLGAYTLLLLTHTVTNALLALAIGSVVGWSANFLASDRFVFRAKPQ